MQSMCPRGSFLNNFPTVDSFQTYFLPIVLLSYQLASCPILRTCKGDQTVSNCKAFTIRETIFQAATIQVVQDFEIILTIKLCAYDPLHRWEESGLTKCLSIHDLFI